MLRHLSLLCSLAMLLAMAVALGIRSEKDRGHMARAYSWVLETLWLPWAADDLPARALAPALHEGSGVTRGASVDDGALILLAGHFSGSDDRARLIRRDGSTVARWDFREAGLARGGKLHGVSLDTRGSLVGVAGGAFVKLGRCGQVVLRAPGNFHHAAVPAEEGGWWALGRDLIDRREAPADYLPPHTSEFFRSLREEDIGLFAEPVLQDDTLVRLGKGGEVLQELSIAKLLHDGGLEHLIRRFAQVDEGELTRSNSVRELPARLARAFPMFKAGDLLLSLGRQHLLLVVDPDTRSIKWHRSGPWSWQHDARFQPDGTITLFNNNHRGVESAGRPPRRYRHNPDLHSNILRVDPAGGGAEVVAGREISSESHFYTRDGGQHQMLPGGDVLVAESGQGRVLQLSSRGEIVWEFVNRHDADRMAKITGARLYPAGHLRVDDWSCPGR